MGAVGIEPTTSPVSRDWHQNSGCARSDALITFVARIRRVVTSFPRCLFALARGGIFDEFAAMPDADLVKRQLLCRLLGLKRTRYAQRELFRV